MDSIVEKNDNEVKERPSGSNINNNADIQETSPSTEAKPAKPAKNNNNGSFRNNAAEEDSTEGKLPDAGGGKNKNKNKNKNNDDDDDDDSEHGKKWNDTENDDNAAAAAAAANTNTATTEQAIVVPDSMKQVIKSGCVDDNYNDNDSETEMDAAEATAAPARSSMTSSSLSRTIPKRKRPRLEKKESFLDENDEDDETTTTATNDMSMDVSLNQLKRQVLGRDLKVDDGEQHDWEDKEDAEIRQIRALMNESSNANDDNDNDDDDDNDDDIDNDNDNANDNANETTNNPLETTTAADKTKDDFEKKDDTERNGFDASTTTTNTTTTTKPSSSSLLSEKLRNDLMCAICHEVVYPPVALQCGHSFCQPCIDWWFDHDDAGRCPTCRHRSSVDDNSTNTKRTSPNLALRACVMAMFGPEIVVRLQNRKKLRQKPKGENGGAHNAGYQILSELRDETWHYVAVHAATKTIQVRRSIVLDAEDQRMQLALAVYHKPIKEVGSSVQRFRVELCLLTMEEDEAVDSGFPTNIVSPEDEFFVCGGSHNNGSSRFLYSHLDVQMKDENGNISPLARVSADVNDGRFKYVLDPSESAGIHASTETIRSLLFEHSETGSQLEIDLAQLQNRACGSSFVPPNQNRNSNRNRDHYYSDDENYDNNRTNFAMERHIDTEEEDEEVENQDEFEEDGFLMGDDDDDDGESNVEGAAFSDEEEEASIDEEDRCVVCKDGGELMICDGGDRNPGCGKSFHAGCVNRSAIPDGDWICQVCAKAGGIETGIVGHEFRESEETTSNNTKRDDGHASQQCDDASCDDDVAGDDNNVDDNSDVEGTFSDDENQKNSDSQKSTNNNVDDEDGSVSQQQSDCEEEKKSVVKPSGRSNKIGTKRRFVLEDSDSDE